VLLLLTTAASAQLVPTGSMPLCDVASSGEAWPADGRLAQPSPAVSPAVSPATAVDAEDAADCGGAMCDASAASIVAEPVVPRARGGSIRELPCEMWRLLGRDRAGRDRAQHDGAVAGIVPPAEPGAPKGTERLPDDVRATDSSSLAMPPRAEAQKVVRAGAVALPRDGFVRLPYRPPVQRLVALRV
jgi:hypothetical protein